MILSNINRLILIMLISFSVSISATGQITVPSSYVGAQKGLA